MQIFARTRQCLEDGMQLTLRICDHIYTGELEIVHVIRSAQINDDFRWGRGAGGAYMCTVICTLSLKSAKSPARIRVLNIATSLA